MPLLTDLTPDAWRKGQLLLVDKPLEWTSFQVVNKIRWALKKRFGFKNIKVGHAGTLDPLATGLLLICVGKWTKKIETFQGMNKEYTGVISLGATTPSYDLETPIDKHYPTDHIDADGLESARCQFLGELQQYPPIFSAIKKEGVRLYEHARQGKTVAISPRTIHIHDFSINTDQFPEIGFCVNCSKGTYIRSLAHDYGQALNSGGHLSVLRRTKIGPYTVEDAYTLSTLIETLHPTSAGS